jgi:hypothetical protein
MKKLKTTEMMTMRVTWIPVVSTTSAKTLNRISAAIWASMFLGKYRRDAS